MSMSKGQQTDPYAASRDRVRYNNVISDLKPTECQIELERYLIRSTLGHLQKVGDGILTATDVSGRVFKIEITQVDGPK